MKDQLLPVLTIVAITGYLLPLIIVLWKGYWNILSLKTFSLYWVLGAIINLLGIIPAIDERTLEIIYVIYNLLDIPIILSLLFLTTKYRPIQNFILITGMCYIFFETVAVYQHGFFYDSMKYSLGAGLALVIFVIIWEIIRFFQRLRHSPQQKRLLFIYIALLFEYGTFVIVYIFDYLVIGHENLDSLLLYYVSALISMVIACTGLLLKLKPSVSGKIITGFSNSEINTGS